MILTLPRPHPIMLCRLLEASSLIDDVFASALAGRIEPEAAVILADAALASPAADSGAHALRQSIRVLSTLQNCHMSLRS